MVELRWSLLVVRKFMFQLTFGHRATIEAVQTANASKGIMTLEDLKNYSVALQTPLSITYRDFKITSTSAPSSGEVVLSVMKAVEGYSTFGEAEFVNVSTQRLDEAIRFGYGQVSVYQYPKSYRS